jgi:hypothetical protein
MLLCQRRFLAPALVFASLLPVAQAQMSGMTMPPSQLPSTVPDMDMSDGMMKSPRTLIAAILQHTSSGTTVEPLSSPTPMWMFRQRAGWTLMLHSTAFLAETQQHASNSRGGDSLFSTNWIMPMAQRKLGRGQLTLRAMLSLEPATITSRFYPELFQQGETAYGRPIADGQHPHDFVMELAALYDLRLTEHSILSFYAAPVGDPAIGPTAYPHRFSASEDPLAALGHHQEDSTHIAFNVFTAGVAYKGLRLEASGFHGAEPDERRWHFQPSPNGLAVDSYSGRLTFAPTANVIAQYSIAHITSPEALAPQENQRRQTASVMYNRPVGGHHDTTSMPGMDMSTPATGNWSTTFIWGQTLSLPTAPMPVSTINSLENSYLLESLLNFHTRNFLFTRVEVAARTSELLDSASSTATPEYPIGHVQAYTFGYDRQYRVAPHLLAAPGLQFTVYRAPDSLSPTYGRTPVGGVVFLRFRIAQ